MTGSGGSGSGKAERLEAALAQLAREGRPDQVDAFRALIDSGLLSADDAVEAIAFAEDMATALGADEITDEQASELVEQLVERHHSGRQG